MYCSQCAVFMSGLVEGEPGEPAAEEHTEVDQGVLHIGDDRVAEDGREDSEVLAVLLHKASAEISPGWIPNT